MSAEPSCAPSRVAPSLIRCARLGAAAVAVAALAVLPGSAAASSIAFVKDNNVWLISPDGSRQRQVTTDGTASTYYNWPSQADDGTILAKRGNHFVRLRPDGTKIGAPVPAIGSDTAHSGNLFVMSGPNHPRISPDGTRFAYWLSVRNIGQCPVFDPYNCSFRDTDYTLVSHVDRFTAGQEFGAVRDYRDPSWIGNDRLLLFNYGLGVRQGAISQVGAGEPGLRQWFDPPSGLTQIGQGELSRQGDKLVTLAGDDAFGPAQRELHFYGVSGGYPTTPESKCYVPYGAPPSGKFLTPSWSPDGTQLAVTQSDGIHVYGNIPDLRVPDPNCAQITDRVLVVGAHPAWGPADVPVTPPPAPPATPQPGTSTATKPMAGVRVASRQRGRAVRVRLRVLTAGATVRVRLLGPRGKVMGSAVKRNARPGKMAVRVPLSRRGRAAQRHRGSLRLAVEVAVAAPGGPPHAVIRRVLLRGGSG
jgi:WD40-like Beta Propeller Repeat